MLLAAIMPEKTGVPTSRLVICAAPVAMTSGNRPKMNAIEVISQRGTGCARRLLRLQQ